MNVAQEKSVIALAGRAGVNVRQVLARRELQWGSGDEGEGGGVKQGGDFALLVQNRKTGKRENAIRDGMKMAMKKCSHAALTASHRAPDSGEAACDAQDTAEGGVGEASLELVE